MLNSVYVEGISDMYAHQVFLVCPAPSLNYAANVFLHPYFTMLPTFVLP
jgi:hypothetical protein